MYISQEDGTSSTQHDGCSMQYYLPPPITAHWQRGGPCGFTCLPHTPSLLPRRLASPCACRSLLPQACISCCRTVRVLFPSTSTDSQFPSSSGSFAHHPTTPTDLPIFSSSTQEKLRLAKASRRLKTLPPITSFSGAAFFSSSGSSTDFPIFPTPLQQQHRHSIPSFRTSPGRPWAFACKIRAYLHRVSDRHPPIYPKAPKS